MSLTPIRLLIALHVFLFPVYVARVFSMSATISQGDYFLVSNITYFMSSPSRGDLVAFQARDGSHVGRIVGVSGDHIQMREGKLYINGVAGELKYDGETNAGCQGYECPTRVYVETLPGLPQHRVMAPNPYGPTGNTAEFIVPLRAYFLLYDNRETSGNSFFSDIRPTGGDSRFSGFILMQSITGKVVSKLFDARTHKWEWIPV
jgi:signal peptidase I